MHRTIFLSLFKSKFKKINVFGVTLVNNIIYISVVQLYNITSVYSIVCSPLEFFTQCMEGWIITSINGQRIYVFAHTLSPALPVREMVEPSVWLHCVLGALQQGASPRVFSEGRQSTWVSFCKYFPRTTLISPSCFLNLGTKLLTEGFTDV